jgi:hypothetical protein
VAALDLKQVELDATPSLDLGAKPKRRQKYADGSMYMPAMPLGWLIAARQEAKGEGQLLFALLLFRKWVMAGGKRPVAATPDLMLGKSSGHDRSRKSMLGKMERRGLIKIMPTPKQRAPSVMVLIPDNLPIPPGLDFGGPS